MAIGDTLRGKSTIGASGGGVRGVRNVMKEGTTPNLSGISLQQPAWYIRTNRSEMYDRLNQRIGNMFNRMIDNSLQGVAEDRAAQAQADEIKKAKEEGRAPDLVKPNGAMRIFNPNAAQAYEQTSRTIFKSDLEVRLRRGASQIQTEVEMDSTIPIHEKPQAFRQRYDDYVQQQVGNIRDFRTQMGAAGFAEQLGAAGEGRLLDMSVTVGRAEQFKQVQDNLDMLQDDVLNAPDLESYRTAVDALNDYIGKTLPGISPTTAEEVSKLDAYGDRAESAIRFGLLNQYTKGMNEQDLTTFRNDLARGQVGDVNFQSDKERQEAVVMLDKQIAMLRGEKARNDSQVKDQYQDTMYRLSQGQEVPQNQIEALRMSPALTAEQKQKLDLAESILPEVQTFNTMTAGELQARLLTEQQLEKELGRTPARKEIIGILSQRVQDAQAARMRQDHQGYAQQSGIVNNEPASPDGTLGDPAGRKSNAAIVDRHFQEQSDFYSEEERVQFSKTFNEGDAEIKASVIRNITQNTPKDRMPLTIRNIQKINPDMAMALRFKQSDVVGAQRVGNLIMEGYAVENGTDMAEVMQQLQTRIAPYFDGLTISGRPAREVYTRAAYNIYKGMSQSQSMPRPDMVEASAQAILGQTGVGSQINGQPTMPFQYGMDRADMAKIWNNMTEQDFLDMNDGVYPVVITSNGVAPIALNDIKASRLIYVGPGKYTMGLNVNGVDTFVMNPMTGKPYVFDFNRKSKELIDRSSSMLYTDQYVSPQARDSFLESQQRLPLQQITPQAQPGIGAMTPPQGYLGRLSKRESGGNPRAQNPNSRASGTYQFLDRTWGELGMDPNQKNDPNAQEVAIRKFTQQNAGILGKTLGREPNDSEMYMAHFFGPQGAVNVLQASPDLPINNIVRPEVIQANPNLDGKTVGDVQAEIVRRFGLGRTWKQMGEAPVQGKVTQTDDLMRPEQVLQRVQDQKAAGESKIKLQEGLAGNLLKQVEQIQAAGDSSDRKVRNLEALVDIARHPDFQSGDIAGLDLVQTAQGIAADLGLDFDRAFGVNFGDLSQKQQFQQISNLFLVEIVKDWKGAISDREMQTFKTMMAQLGQSEEANAAIMARSLINARATQALRDEVNTIIENNPNISQSDLRKKINEAQRTMRAGSKERETEVKALETRILGDRKIISQANEQFGTDPEDFPEGITGVLRNDETGQTLRFDPARKSWVVEYDE